MPSCGLLSLHTADLEPVAGPHLRVPPAADRVLLTGRSAAASLPPSRPLSHYPCCHPSPPGKLLFTTTRPGGTEPPRVSVCSAVLAEARAEEPLLPARAVLHSFSLAPGERVLMAVPVRPSLLQEPLPELPEKPKKPFKLLVRPSYLGPVSIYSF